MNEVRAEKIIFQPYITKLRVDIYRIGCHEHERKYISTYYGTKI
jgi:hypothetical protein